MIPKIIHYIWVGDQPKPDLILKCISSWKEHLSDYEFLEWDNNSIKKIDNRYLQEAFQQKKWAFVADYLRVYALYHYGGIYLDTDTEIKQSLSIFLKNTFFSGFELYEGEERPFAGVIGAIKNCEITKDLLSLYADIPFIKTDRSLDLTTSPARYAMYYANKFNYTKPAKGYDGSKIVELTQGVKLYPYFFFCTPVNNKPLYAIHHFAGSWLDGYSRRKKFGLGELSLIRFKRENYKSNSLPLYAGERILIKIKIKNNIFALTKKE